MDGDSTHTDYAKSILLPFDQVFRNLKNAKRFAIDIGKTNEKNPPKFSQICHFLFLRRFIGKISILFYGMEEDRVNNTACR